MQGDLAMLWQLVESGLTALPVANSDGWFVEAAWNHYVVDSLPMLNANGTYTPGKFGSNYAGSDAGNGGVDFTRPMPWYQDALLHLTPPETTDGTHAHGRGMPDVAANAGGNMFYIDAERADDSRHPALTAAPARPRRSGPRWPCRSMPSSRPGLPKLGYMTDLLYIAAAIAPGSFNDVTVGNNVSSLRLWRPLAERQHGDHADRLRLLFGSGLRPDERIGLAQRHAAGTGLERHRPWTDVFRRRARRHRRQRAVGLAQRGRAERAGAGHVGRRRLHDPERGSDGFSVYSVAAGIYAWTSRLAQQSLQDDFDPKLVRLFDKQGHGMLSEVVLSAGESLGVHIDGVTAQATQAL